MHVGAVAVAGCGMGYRMCRVACIVSAAGCRYELYVCVLWVSGR